MTPIFRRYSVCQAVRYSVLRVHPQQEKQMTRSFVWPVSMTVRFHLFPFRTQKLSSLVPKIVGWKRPVKIGRCRLLKTQPPGRANGPARGCLYAPLAQLVEQLTLNQWVLGSSPRWCTKKGQQRKLLALFFLLSLCTTGKMD